MFLESRESQQYISAEKAIQEEVAAILRPEKVAHAPTEPGAAPSAAPRHAGKLALLIHHLMGLPASSAPAPHDARATMNHRPPGEGAGMVNIEAGPPLFALCLSGGGIRSAAFCLGAVQALAQDRLLSKFHYLSTVSGGGYTGSLIARLIQTTGGVQPAETALADPQNVAAAGWLQTLRDYTSYLAPRLSAMSLDVWAVGAIYLRNTLANWVLFLPGLIALALVPRLYLRLMELSAGADDGVWLPAILACIGLVLAGMGACLLIPGHQPPAVRPAVTANVVLGRITAPLSLAWAFLVPLWFVALRGADFALIPLTGAAMSMIAYLAAWAYAEWGGLPAVPLFRLNILGWIVATAADSAVILTGILLLQGWMRHLPQPTASREALILAVIGPGWVVLSHLLHAACYAILRREVPSAWMDREWIGRLSGSEMMAALLWTGLAAICLLLPHALNQMLGVNYQAVAWPAVLSGPIAAWLGRSSLTVAETAVPKVRRTQVLVTLLAAAASLLFLVTLLMAGSTGGWRSAAWVTSRFQLFCCRELAWGSADRVCAPGFWTLFPEPFLLAIVSLALGKWVININRYSLHEVYRNRLVRAFLGSGRPRGARQGDGFTNFDEADGLRLSDAMPFYPTAALSTGLRLFPVVNTTLNLASGARTAWAERRAASFTMTPLHCGSAILREDGAYVPSAVYGGTPFAFPPGTLNPGIQLGTAMTISGAAVSPNMGYHSSPTTSFIMTLFNARLGAWMPNPAKASPRDMSRSRPLNGFRALVSEMLCMTNDKRSAVYLSDGGHFENLGLYEMLRRRCQVILVFDAGCDPNYAYDDLGNALRKARIDLGVEVTFPRNAGPIPGTAPAPPFLRAAIAYPAGRAMPAGQGHLLYVKAHLPPAAPADILAFKASDARFPHDSTSNQFFTESQFESYRKLGFYLAS